MQSRYTLDRQGIAGEVTRGRHLKVGPRGRDDVQVHLMGRYDISGWTWTWLVKLVLRMREDLIF